MKRIVLAVVSVLLFDGTAALGQVKARKLWTLDKGLAAPESAYWHSPSKTLFVSNIKGDATAKDGEGWISRVSPEGRMLETQWVKGLNAPKGLRAHAGLLWVSDIDRILAFRIKDGGKAMDIKVPGAKFLNDVAISSAGDVYVSDMLTHRIHRVRGKKVEVFLEGQDHLSPNGLLVGGPYLRVASWGPGIKGDFTTSKPGSLYNVNLATKKKTWVSRELGNLDGLESLGRDLQGFVVSDWMKGTVYRVAKTKVEILVQGLKGAADIGYIPDKRRLVVPEMLADKLHGYELDGKAAH